MLFLYAVCSEFTDTEVLHVESWRCLQNCRNSQSLIKLSQRQGYQTLLCGVTGKTGYGLPGLLVQVCFHALHGHFNIFTFEKALYSLFL